ncbi:hypothetical protein JCM10212_001204, partial [Sporobolomyces blumeae]
MKDHSLWLVTAPSDSSNPLEQLHDLRHAMGDGKLGQASLVQLPEFK